MFSVEKNDGRVVEFDISKISEAIMKALDTLELAFEEIDEMVEEAIGSFGRAMYTLAHSLAHWVLHTFFKSASRIRQAVTFDSHSAILLATVICIRVKLFTASFLGNAYAYRATCLFRTQDRGVDDNSDSDTIDINFRNYIPIEITKQRSLTNDTFRELYCGFNGRIHAALYPV